MDFWSKARSFAEEAAKRSQELTKEAAKRSQELTSNIGVGVGVGGTSRIADIVSETAKRSKELATEASNQIKAEALKRADQIKSLSLIDSSSSSSLNESSDLKQEVSSHELQRFGITHELREFVQEIAMSTFQNFPLPDDAPMSNVPTVSNVQQDLTEWQARHATLMLSTVKEISKLRYELCPRVMKERKFWRIYFMLVNSHISPYETRYNEEVKLKVAEQEKTKADKEKKLVKSVAISKPDGAEPTQLLKTSSSAEQDLDAFLLGDLGDSDGPDDVDDGDDHFNDDFDKIDDSSEDERGKDTKK